jgi:hypothetical protein
MKPEGESAQPAFRPTWKKVFKSLVTRGVTHHGLGLEDAKQFAQETMRRFLDPDHARHAVETEAELHRVLGSILNGLLVNYRRHEAHGRAWLAHAEPLVDHAASPEDTAIAEERARAALAMIAARVRGRPLVAKLVALILDGVHGAAEQAAMLGEPIERVYEARTTIAHLAEAIEKKLGGN